jgi:hypothetical protein
VLYSHEILEVQIERVPIGSSYRKHAAHAQLHRWYQCYELPTSSLVNQLDILDANIRLKSGIGEGTGHEAYKARVAAIPKEWKNAHFVKGVDIDVHAGGSIDMTAQVTYLNVGIKPNGSVRTAELSYVAKLKATETVLPRFTAIAIAQLSEGETATFKEAYGQNRMKRMSHYWLALIENPVRDAVPSAEILGDEFLLDLGGDKIRSRDELHAWFATSESSATKNAYEIVSFSVRETGLNRYEVTANLRVFSLEPNGQPSPIDVRYRFQVNDNPTARFAKIARCDVVTS